MNKGNICAFWNVNSNCRLNDPNDLVYARAWPELTDKSRIKQIMKNVFILINKYPFVCLLEVNEQISHEIKKETANFSILYRRIPYNTSKSALNFVVLSRYPAIMETIEEFPLTKSGKSFPDALRPVASKEDEEPTREFLEYHDEVFGETKNNMVIRVTVKNIDVYIVHLGITNYSRLYQTDKLTEIIQKNSYANGRKVIVCGDFNCFNNMLTTPALYVDPMNLLREKLKIKWITEESMFKSRVFPFDIVFRLSEAEKVEYFNLHDTNKIEEFKAFCEKMGDKYGLETICLDHVFGHDDFRIEYSGTLSPLSDHPVIMMKIEDR